jgi:hypothetical protein
MKPGNAGGAKGCRKVDIAWSGSDKITGKTSAFGLNLPENES